MKKTKILVDPVLYYSWFKVDHKRYVINIGQNILFWIFPFLMYIFPLKCYEVQNNEDWKKKKKKKNNLLYGNLGVICGLIGSSTFFTHLINCMDIGINVPPIISIIIAISVGFTIVITMERKGKKYETRRVVRVQVHPDDFTETVKQFFGHVFFLLATCVSINILYANPGNIYWFLGVVFLIWLLSLTGSSCLIGKVKVKLLKSYYN